MYAINTDICMGVEVRLPGLGLFECHVSSEGHEHGKMETLTGGHKLGCSVYEGREV